jgi:hypothetical protein
VIFSIQAIGNWQYWDPVAVAPGTDSIHQR